VQIIVNPAAAGGRLGRQWPRLERRLHELGIRLPTVWTEAPAHATELAAAAVRDGHEVVVAAGGDGTICEVLEGLQQAGRGTLAILPLGTGNDAARAVGVPRRFEAAARLLQHGEPHAVDVVRAGARSVLNAIGVGLLGEINVNASRMKAVRGITAYFTAASATLFRYRCPEIELRDGDGFHYAGAMTILAIQSGPTTGGGFRLCPGARTDDGEFDITLVSHTGVPARLGAVTHALRGTLARKAFTTEHRGRRLELRCEVPLACHWDGNPGAIEPPGIVFELLPGAQPVLLPPRPPAA